MKLSSKPSILSHVFSGPEAIKLLLLGVRPLIADEQITSRFHLPQTFPGELLVHSAFDVKIEELICELPGRRRLYNPDTGVRLR